MISNEKEARERIKESVASYYHEYLENKNYHFKPGDRINYAGRVFDENEMKNLIDASLDFWLTSGRFSFEFEHKFSSFLGVKYTHLVNSGSSANLLAFSVLTADELENRKVQRGDEVITVACSFPTTVTPILQYGAVPVFVDVSIPSYNINVDDLEQALSKKTKAVMLAHSLGNPFNIAKVKEFCEKNNLWLIEDNCDSLGSLYSLNGETRYTGTWGDIGTSSFYPPHHITMGEGGCVYTNNPLLSKLLLSYRDWGRDCVCPSGVDNFCKQRFSKQYGELPKGYDHKYVYSHFGYNLKATDLQAAIGLSQVDKLATFIAQRRLNWERLKNNLSVISKKVILPKPEENSIPSWFGFIITLPNGISRNRVTKELEEKNIQTRLLFSGNIIRHPCFNSIRGTTDYRVVGDLVNTDVVMNQSFWVGVYPGLTNEKIDFISDTIIQAVNK